MNKKSFSLIEIIFVISILAIITSYSISKNNLNKLNLAKDQIIMHLKYMRYIALLDNKYEHNNDLWFRKAWNLKFRRCNNDTGIHYYIYSDNDNSGHAKEEESLKDPLTQQYIYSSTACIDKNNRTNYTLLSKYYNIKSVDISCNNTSSSLGQILYLNDGIAYSRFENNKNSINKYKINQNCTIKLIDFDNNYKIITVEGKTGYVY